MRIGFDFDNTIVSYDALFHKVAREQGVIDDTVPVNKLAVRDHLRATGREPIWTEMQGYVYGARMSEAQAYPDVINVLRELKNAGHTLAIISHKTRFPYAGQQYDLHAAARSWVKTFLTEKDKLLINNDFIYYELTKEEKIARIRKFQCDIFIDDLPEILTAKHFPTETKRFLFDPDQHHAATELADIEIVSSWSAFKSCLT